MGLIAFMHDYEFVRRLRFFVLQTSEHFVPTLFSSYTSSNSFLPSKLEFTLVLLFPSPTTTERIFFLFVPLLGSSRLCSATTHSLTRSLVLAPDQEHCHHLFRSDPPLTSLYSSSASSHVTSSLRPCLPSLSVPLLCLYACYSLCLSLSNALACWFSHFIAPLLARVSSRRFVLYVRVTQLCLPSSNALVSRFSLASVHILLLCASSFVRSLWYVTVTHRVYLCLTHCFSTFLSLCSMFVSPAFETNQSTSMKTAPALSLARCSRFQEYISN